MLRCRPCWWTAPSLIAKIAARMALESINTGSPMAMSKSYRAMGKDIAALAAFCKGISSTRIERA
jgi:hypothetical protein